MSPAPPSLTAALAGRYRIERELGRGGSATVYLAEDLKHGRRVAIKVLDPEAASAIGPDRFLREIEIAARLTHPHILPLHDSGDANGELYYVMPYVEGESLRARMDRDGRMEIEDVVRIGREIASGLGYAHHRGLVHRDVKPENVLLADGIAMIADFGIARALIADDRRFTTTVGTMMGTPLYMAPEQALGSADLDGRADLYSLGCVVYEMLTGQPPFSGPTLAGLAYQHQAQIARPVDELRREVPRGMSAVVARALAKKPAERYPTAARFAEALSLAPGETPTLHVSEPAIAVPNNLPKERTRFVGRERELSECAERITETRLLTLTGVGGSGKTRLALRLARNLLERHPDGVWFVDLAPISDPGRVPGVVAAALDLKEEPGTPATVLLARELEHRNALLVLDNCEHLLPACAELANELLGSCDELRLIATSREALGVDGELPVPVRLLSVPAQAALRLREVEASEAVQLFVDRARMVAPDFTLDERNAPGVAEICRRLDGIPLAIELAAARMRLLSVEQIRSKLDDRFRLLTGGERALSRHQTLRATLQWSYDHLTAEAQQLFRELSVFAGGWTLEAAAAVSAAGGDEFEVLDQMTRLADKSLLVVARDAEMPRYRMLETMREFAQERLIESGQAEAGRTRHLEFHVALAERTERELEGAAQAEWLRRLDHELDNLLVAHAWCERDGQGGAMDLRLAAALRSYWPTRGQMELGLRVTREALARAGAGGPDAVRAKALSAAGQLAYLVGDRAHAREPLEQSLAISNALGDRTATSRGLSFLAAVAIDEGDREGAHRALGQAVALARETGDRMTLNMALNSLAELHRAEGELAEAAALYRQVHGLSRELGSTFHIAATLCNLAMTEMGLGELEGAREKLLEALVLAEGIGSIRVGLGALDAAAGLAAARGEGGSAARFWGAADAERERTRGRRDPADERILAPLLDRARTAFGAEAFALRYAGGHELSNLAAMAEARSWLGIPTRSGAAR